MSDFLEIYRGVIVGLIGALCIGLGFVIYKQASDVIDVVALNYARAGLGMGFFVLCVMLLNKIAQILTLTRNIVIFLAISVVFNVLIGDTLYFRSQQLIGASKAFPIVNMTPLFTLFSAHYLLGEPLTEKLFAGVIFVLFGVYFAAHPHNAPSQSSDIREPVRVIWIGILLAVIATFSWTLGTICLRIGVQDTDIFIAGAVRYIAVVLFMFPVYIVTRIHFFQSNIRNTVLNPERRHLLYLIVGGAVLNVMLGGIFYFSSLKELGASKTTTIYAIAPLFGIGFSAFLSEEHITWKTILGALMTVIGVGLIV